MNLDEAFPSKYVKASELKGREITVVIQDATIEELGKDRKLVIYFQNAQKGLVCNKTNRLMIEDVYGNETDNWIGRPIILYAARVMFENRMVDAIRVRIPPKANPVATAPQKMREQPLPGDSIGVPMSNGRRSAPDEPPPHLDDEVPF